MIQVSKVQYDLVVVTPQGKRLHISEFAQGPTWEEQPDELAVRLRAELVNQKTTEGWLHQLLPLAGQVLVYASWGGPAEEILRGTVFDWRYKTETLGVLSITVYDMLAYLRSEDDRYYSAGTQAKTIIQDIANSWKIPFGTVEGPNVALAKQVFRATPLASIIQSVLEQARKKGGGEYVVRAKAGKVDVVKAGANNPVYHFGADDVVRQVDDQRSITGLVTRVKIVGAEDTEGRAPVAATVSGRTDFGILQEVVHEEKYETPAAAQEAAKTILADKGSPATTQRIVAPDLPFLRRGDKVHVTAGTLNGYYVVKGIQHEAETQTMTMEVRAA